MAASGDNRVITYDYDFVEDVRRTMAACAIFLFFPIQQINDGCPALQPTPNPPP